MSLFAVCKGSIICTRGTNGLIASNQIFVSKMLVAKGLTNRLIAGNQISPLFMLLRPSTDCSSSSFFYDVIVVYKSFVGLGGYMNPSLFL